MSGLTGNFPSEDEWKRISKRFYDGLISYGYQIVEFPAHPDPPGAVVKNIPEVEIVRVSYNYPTAKVFNFDDVFANEEAMSQLVTWATSQYFPESD